MITNRLEPILAGFICTVFLNACSTTPLGTGADGTLDDDEQRLWNTVVQEESRIDQSGLLYNDPAVTTYVNSVLAKLYPPDPARRLLSPEVKVLKNPLLNAFAFPNGKIYVHTGMLARIQSEAQLATLLGHELTHATHRHTIQELRGRRRTSAALVTFQVLTLPFGVFGAAASALGTVGYVGAVTGYSRGKEHEADKIGLDLMVQAGYHPQEATKLFEKLKEDLTFRKVDEPFFFGSHPRVQERIDSFNELAADKYAGVGGAMEADRYYQVMTPLIIDNAETDLAIGRLVLARRNLNEVLNRQPDNARAHFLMGEVFRQGHDPGDEERADSHYHRAVESDSTLADPHRALGYSLLKRGDRSGGRSELLKYLELAPRAADRGYVEQALKEHS